MKALHSGSTLGRGATRVGKTMHDSSTAPRSFQTRHRRRSSPKLPHKPGGAACNNA